MQIQTATLLTSRKLVELIFLLFFSEIKIIKTGIENAEMKIFLPVSVHFVVKRIQAAKMAH